MRIFDRIASGESVLAWTATRPASQVDAYWRKVTHEATRVIADDAAEYVWLGHKADPSKSVDRFGSILPPFPLLWIEWTVPRRFLELTGSEDAKHREEFGIDPSAERIINDQCVMLLRSSQGQGTFKMSAQMLNGSSSGRGGIGVSPVEFAVLADVVQETGQVVTTQDILFDGNEDGSIFGRHFHPGWVALAWMNSRTFERELVDVPAGQRKKRSRRNRFPGHDYYKIVIGPKYRKKWESESGVDASKFYTVAGKLADYTRTGLFGDPTRKGYYWKPAHEVGKREHGTVVKEYHVAAEASA